MAYILIIFVTSLDPKCQHIYWRILDVNECEVLSLDVCGRNGACVNTVGSYNCQCADGSVNDTCEGKLIGDIFV